MKNALLQEPVAITRLNLFLALSRTPHLLLDLATPGLAALLCLGSFPAPDVLLLGLITAFAGYTAVYALNDIIDYRVDRETVSLQQAPASKKDLDSIFVRHPLAQGLLTYRAAWFWTIGWASLATVGAFILNPVCLVIFLIASLLEVVYCHLLKITCLRSVVSGIVKTSGPLAAAFAVNPSPPPSFLIILFVWLFFWEIGGQNVPNDLSDWESDRNIQARTIPVQFGKKRSVLLIRASLVIAVIMSLAIFWTPLKPPGYLYLPGALLAGCYFLLYPCNALFRGEPSEESFQLFNRASYYPLSILFVIILSWAFR
jgi:4-hydroxybenzoate polyprenyltransferase